MLYYLTNNGQQMGPFDETQLVANGMTANSYVWWEGQPRWVPASQVPALAPYLQQPRDNDPYERHPVAYGPPTDFYNNQRVNATQPYYGYQGSIPPRPESNMVWAILCTVLCCLPLGIVAIVQASGVDSAYNAGNYAEAERKSKSAKKWAMWGAISSVIFLVLYIIFVIGVMGANGAF